MEEKRKSVSEFFVFSLLSAAHKARLLFGSFFLPPPRSRSLLPLACFLRIDLEREQTSNRRELPFLKTENGVPRGSERAPGDAGAARQQSKEKILPLLLELLLSRPFFSAPSNAEWVKPLG